MLPPKQRQDLDQQNDDDQHLEQKSSCLMELVDHELVKSGSRLEFLIDEASIVGYSDTSGRQPVHPGIEHVADEFERIVDPLREFDDVEPDRVQLFGLA